MLATSPSFQLKSSRSQSLVAERAKRNAAALETLKTMPARMQAAAHSREELCVATCVPPIEIVFPIGYRHGGHLNPSRLRGMSLHIFTMLQEMGFKPVLNALSHDLYAIQAPVLPPTGAGSQ